MSLTGSGMYHQKKKSNFLSIAIRDLPGPGKSRLFLVIIIPVPIPVNFRNKPGLTGAIFTKVLLVQDCKYLF